MINDELVVVIEDEPGVRALLRTVVELAGARAVLTADGEAGLMSVRTLRPHLVLLNIEMPKLNGIEVCQRLKADLATQAIPIVIVSASGHRRPEALAAGCIDYVEKPFAPGRLAAKVRGYLAATRRRPTEEGQARETILAILKRAHDDLAFRRRYEQDPAGALAEYSDLTDDERQFLAAYPAYWLSEHQIQPCPRCGADAVVSRTGSVVFCPTCQSHRDSGDNRPR